MQSVNDSIGQLLSSLYITTQLQSPTAFQTHIDSIVQQSKSTAPAAFARLLLILRATNHGNAIISSYETNFKYYFPHWFYSEYHFNFLTNASLALTEPVTYDNDCSCAFYANCTTQAGFFETNSSEIIPIKGLKMGCTPSESFLSSTLECFYDSSCINLIETKIKNTTIMNTTYVTELLYANSSRFLPDTTIIDLVNELFIETWLTTMNYSAYFDYCSPTYCSYTYIQQLSSLYTVTLLLGLYGGLSVILKWICPKIVYILFNIYQYRKKQSNRVTFAHTTEAVVIETDSTANTSINHQNTTVHSESEATVSTPETMSYSVLLRSMFIGFLVLILMSVALIGPFVYFSRQGKNQATEIKILHTNTFIIIGDESGTCFFVATDLGTNILAVEQTYNIKQLRRKFFNGMPILTSTINSNITLSNSSVTADLTNINHILNLDLSDKKSIITTIEEIGALNRSNTCSTCKDTLTSVDGAAALVYCQKCKRHSLKKNINYDISTSLSIKQNQEKIMLWASGSVVEQLLQVVDLTPSATDTEIAIALLSNIELRLEYSELRKELISVSKP
ncbi:unnamed protein product [Adineta steineri]|uniref:Uncharacterized protein n=1 Tax=Adineta steineri TaxID=433720 RepID=A0A814M4M0_9BILA|nr:unnamed protein product [Adineta steineri]